MYLGMAWVCMCVCCEQKSCEGDREERHHIFMNMNLNEKQLRGRKYNAFWNRVSVYNCFEGIVLFFYMFTSKQQTDIKLHLKNMVIHCIHLARTQMEIYFAYIFFRITAFFLQLFQRLCFFSAIFWILWICWLVHFDLIYILHRPPFYKNDCNSLWHLNSIVCKSFIYNLPYFFLLLWNSTKKKITSVLFVLWWYCTVCICYFLMLLLNYPVKFQ